MEMSEQSPLYEITLSATSYEDGHPTVWDESDLSPHGSNPSGCLYDDLLHISDKNAHRAANDAGSFTSTSIPSMSSFWGTNSAASSSTLDTQLRLESTGASLYQSATLETLGSFLTEEQRWEAIITRNPLADSHFYYLVPSTKIYCKPTCPSRRPTRHTITYVTHPRLALDQGYRPCKRCRPDQSLSAHDERQGRAINRAQEVILSRVVDDQSVLKLEDLAREVGMSKYHFQRVFKKIVGVTPDGYAKSLQALIREQGQA